MDRKNNAFNYAYRMELPNNELAPACFLSLFDEFIRLNKDRLTEKALNSKRFLTELPNFTLPTTEQKLFYTNMYHMFVHRKKVMCGYIYTYIDFGVKGLTLYHPNDYSPLAKNPRNYSSVRSTFVCYPN